mmetsp:Transcript_154085/g.493908  ORF Transcript_154085/g.493908 Transcript_154085/m.493908 type:complete len:202 (+) Transcript_154085:119-724(+)
MFATSSTHGPKSKAGTCCPRAELQPRLPASAHAHSDSRRGRHTRNDRADVGRARREPSEEGERTTRRRTKCPSAEPTRSTTSLLLPTASLRASPLAFLLRCRSRLVPLLSEDLFVADPHRLQTRECGMVKHHMPNWRKELSHAPLDEHRHARSLHTTPCRCRTWSEGEVGGQTPSTPRKLRWKTCNHTRARSSTIRTGWTP